MTRRVAQLSQRKREKKTYKVLQYMHRYTGSGVLALANSQDPAARARKSSQQVPGPARNQSKRARTSRTRSIQYNCRNKSTTLETAPSPEGQGPACYPRSPRICICHTLLGACLSVSPWYNCPPFLSALALVSSLKPGARERRSGTVCVQPLSVQHRLSTQRHHHPPRPV